MDKANIKEAARLLVRARATGELLPGLPEACRPRDAAEAYSIELAVIAELGETIGGYKVTIRPGHGLLTGLMLASRVYPQGAAVDTSGYSMRGVEIEIAIRLDRAFAPRDDEYQREEIARGVTALTGVEIVESRLTNFEDRPVLDRMADFLANGAYVVGPARTDWREFELERLEAHVAFDGREQVRRVGGHPSVDPLLPAIAFINRQRRAAGLAEGVVITTGSYTGITLAPRHCAIEAGFSGFGLAMCQLTASSL
jgi:2-keto-4-pentenoate hydratase